MLSLLLLPDVALAQGAPWPSRLANQYWPLKEARVAAYRRHDRAFFEALLADEFVSLSPGGARVDRAHYLDAELGSGRAEGPATDTRVFDFQVSKAGNTLVLAYEEEERTKVGEAELRVRLGRLDVYTLRRGRWRLLTMTAVRIPEAPTAITLREEQLREYLGVYEFGPGVRSTLGLKDGRLIEQTTGQPPSELVPIGPDLFYQPPELEARVEFERDGAGKVVAQVYRSGGQRLIAKRVE